MCTLLFRHRPGDEYPLALLANRDEAYGRPAAGWAWRGVDRAFFAPLDRHAGGNMLEYLAIDPVKVAEPREELLVEELAGQPADQHRADDPLAVGDGGRDDSGAAPGI